MTSKRLATTVPLCGALLAVSVGAAGLYGAYRTTLTAEASCRSLRTSILSVLERDANESAKRALVHKDVVDWVLVRKFAQGTSSGNK